MRRSNAGTPDHPAINAATLKYAAVTFLVSSMSLLLFIFGAQLGDTHISLLYLPIVLFCATTSGMRLAVYCGVLSFLCYVYFLIPPPLSFAVDSPVKLLDPLTFLITALVAGALSERSRQNAIEKVSYQQASQFRATILHLVSHNLRTPVATIKTALTSLLAMEDSSDHRQELLHAADQDCDRLNRLIGNVLQISRLDAHAVQLNTDWNGLDEVISSVFGRWKEAVENKQLVASIPPDLPLINFDFELIESVLTNLVENAFRHGRPPIRVVVKRCSDQITVDVEDHGPGVATEQRTRLFDQFFTSKSTGLGLGLTVSKGLIEAHGGKLGATFEPGKTTFSFALPLTTMPEVDDDSPFGG